MQIREQPSLSDDEPTLVWIIAGSDDRWRYHMTAVSTASAKVHHPAARLVWLTPRRELVAVVDQIPCYLRDSVTVIGVEPPHTDPRLASRFIKVNLRTLIDAPRFIFLDGDTLLVRPLSWSNWKFSGLAASPNRDGDGRFGEERDNLYAQSLFAAAGWDWSVYRSRPYLNTGFIAFSSDASVDDFTRAWAHQWEDFRRRTGQYYDQPAFNRAAALLGGVAELASAYNAPVAILPQTAKDAAVFHYYASALGDWRRPHTLLGKYVCQSVEQGDVMMKSFRRALHRGKPFVSMGATPQEYDLAEQPVFRTLAQLEQWRQRKLRRIASIRNSISKRYRRWILRQPPA